MVTFSNAKGGQTWTRELSLSWEDLLKMSSQRGFCFSPELRSLIAQAAAVSGVVELEKLKQQKTYCPPEEVGRINEQIKQLLEEFPEAGTLLILSHRSLV